jgi:O-antigen/teichoic acid export membrane protein
MLGSMTSSVPRPTLRQRVLRAGAWNLAGYGVSQALRLGGNLVMTRLLAPEMFGIMAIATLVAVILSMLSDLGIYQNIVQSRRGDDPLFLDTAWVVQIVRSAVLWAAALLIAGALQAANSAALLPAGTVYASPMLPAIIAVSSFAVVIAGFQSTRFAQAQRRFEQKPLVQIEVASQCAALAVMIVFGLLTRSIWALVAGTLVGSLATTLLSHLRLSGHANRLRWEPEALRELLHFGKWIFISSGVFVLVANGDRLLLGALVDEATLGLYAIAALIIGAVEASMTRLFATVYLPALSEVARTDPARLRAVYYKLRVPGDLLLLFLAGLLFAAGQLVIDVLYDPRYAGAGAVLQILALSLVGTRYLVSLQVYLAIGRPRYQAIVNLMRFVSLYALVPTAYLIGGVTAAIWTIALHALAVVPFFYRVNASLKLNDWRLEALVLTAFPAGLALGWELQYLFSGS